MAMKFWDCMGKLHIIEHNIGPMHRTFLILLLVWGLCGRDFNSVTKLLKGRWDVATATKF